MFLKTKFLSTSTVAQNFCKCTCRWKLSFWKRFYKIKKIIILVNWSFKWSIVTWWQRIPGQWVTSICYTRQLSKSCTDCKPSIARLLGRTVEVSNGSQWDDNPRLAVPTDFHSRKNRPHHLINCYSNSTDQPLNSKYTTPTLVSCKLRLHLKICQPVSLKS